MADRSTKKNSKVAPGRPRSRGRYVPRRKVCPFCVERNAIVDYKDSGRLRRFLTDRCKIATRRRTGVCAGHQRELALAIKRARHLALLPYTPAHTRATV